MKIKAVLHTVGSILLIEACLLIIPAAVGAIYHEQASLRAFLISAAATAAAGGVLILGKSSDSNIYAREGFAIVGLSWILLSFFGSLPFVISGQIPHIADAFFETASGFTTTGASILNDVEALDQAMLFWRSFTHWIGGMGVLVFGMIIVPLGGRRSMHLLRAESPGPSSEKLAPKMRDTARILYGIYLALSVILLIFLTAGGMPLFDSLINVFGTAGTGGFSNHAASIAYYDSEYFEVVIGVFMLLFGINFNLYYLLLLKRVKASLGSEELHWYLGIVAFAVITIAVNINSLFDSFRQALRYSFFQVSTIITTTGFATTDFDQWPQYSRTILVLLMLIGACAGSTGGGIKVSRLILFIRSIKNGIYRMIHSKSVRSMRFEGRIVEESTMNSCYIYLSVYCLIIIVSMVIVSLDNFSFETNLTGVIACLNNIGPGLGMVGPAGNFSAFSVLSKLVLSFDMLAGRLELFPILLLFSPSTWKRS
ncbi:MAG: TrkH family potassium uptake protein [Mogibacterium sp.]|nr:TrkH family potassium uptake protein [Mogibacterium sp.]